MRFVFIFIAAFFIVTSTWAQGKPSTFKTHDTLQEVTVHSQSVQRVLKSAREYVVDYDFVDGYVLVASYSGTYAKKSKLFLLSRSGDTASVANLPDLPEQLFRSCGGRLYCITGRAMYPLEIDTGNLQISQAYSLSVFDDIKDCQFIAKDRIYYKIADRQNFNIRYVFYKTNDTRRYRALVFDDEKARDHVAWEESEFVSVAEIAGMRHLMNKNAWAYLDHPVFFENDKIRVFDFRDKVTRLHNVEGDLLQAVPLHLSFTNVQRMEVIKDPVTNEYYLHRSDNMETQTIARINMQTGEIYRAIPIEKPFISKLKVFDGEIYYLYQNPAEPSTQQLYVQKGF